MNGELVTELVIPDGVSEIKNYAFWVCSGLTSVTIPNSVTSIGNGAFEDCTGLTSVTIPNSVTSIGGWAFSGCSGLKEVHISDLTSWCNIDFNDYDSNPLSYAHNLYLNGELVTEHVIPDGVSKIKNYAFYYCSGLTSIKIPNSVTSIGRDAFYDCSGLTSVTIGNSVTSIGSSAFGCSPFYDCSELKEVHISDLAAWCGIDFEDHFSNPLFYAHNLYLNGELVTGLVIPDGVNEIKQHAFKDCTGLTSVTIPNSVTSIGDEAFSDCYGLTSVTIGNSVTSIGDFAFYGCSELMRVDIVDGVKSIGYYAFAFCSNLEELYISNTIESIANCAFEGCTNILEIKVGSKNAITCSEDIFSEDVYNNALLCVPEGRKSVYEKTAPWNRFYIVETDYTDINGVKEQIAENNTVYDLQGRKVENPTNGIYIVNGKKVFVK
ncbi:MAG: leucine-rich repeat domain-containing protein [Bacteroidaceae bacterium]|nr:leucine-rich repeat domain-containing protein [Bacteroidaceae bacterium]